MTQTATNQSRMEACWIGFAACLFVLYCALFFSLDALPFLDLPSHLVRSGVIIELLRGTNFSDLFWVDIGFQPYLWGDAAFGAVIFLLGPILAARTWITLSFAIVPLSILPLSKKLRLSRTKLLFVFFLMLYLATDWFFLAAFTNFRFGLAASLLALALIIPAPSDLAMMARPRQAILFFFLLLTAYLLHFATFFFLAIFVACIVALEFTRKHITIQRALLLLVPIALIGLFHFTRSEGHGDYFQTWIMRSLSEKIKAIGTMLVRFDLTTDIAFSSCLALTLFIPLVSGLREFRRRSLALELLLTTIVLGLVYLALPVAVATLSDVDGRALPFIFATTTILAAFVGRAKVVRLLIPVCATLATLNLLYLASPLIEQNEYLRIHREALLTLPPHKRLLPVTTHPEIGRIHTTTHAGDLYTLLRGGFSPYISNAYLGEPFTYFHYRAEYYAPLIFWYERNLPVEWSKIQEFYDYVVVTKPFDPVFFPSQTLEPEFENAAATIFRVKPANP